MSKKKHTVRQFVKDRLKDRPEEGKSRSENVEGRQCNVEGGLESFRQGNVEKRKEHISLNIDEVHQKPLVGEHGIVELSPALIMSNTSSENLSSDENGRQGLSDSTSFELDKKRSCAKTDPSWAKTVPSDDLSVPNTEINKQRTKKTKTKRPKPQQSTGAQKAAKLPGYQELFAVLSSRPGHTLALVVITGITIAAIGCIMFGDIASSIIYDHRNVDASSSTITDQGDVSHSPVERGDGVVSQSGIELDLLQSSNTAVLHKEINPSFGKRVESERKEFSESIADVKFPLRGVPDVESERNENMPDVTSEFKILGKYTLRNDTDEINDNADPDESKGQDPHDINTNAVNDSNIHDNADINTNNIDEVTQHDERIDQVYSFLDISKTKNVQSMFGGTTPSTTPIIFGGGAFSLEEIPRHEKRHSDLGGFLEKRHQKLSQSFAIKLKSGDSNDILFDEWKVYHGEDRPSSKDEEKEYCKIDATVQDVATALDALKYSVVVWNTDLFLSITFNFGRAQVCICDFRIHRGQC